MIIKQELQINHYVVRTDTDNSYKEDFFYAPIKEEDAKRHKMDGPALVYKSKTEKMEYFEWWNKDKLIATYNSKTKQFKKTDNNSFADLQEFELPNKWKGLEGTLSIDDIRLCNTPILKKDESNEIGLADKEQAMDNIARIQKQLIARSVQSNYKPN